MTTQIAKYSAIDKGIGAMTKKYKLVPDCQDKDGFEDCKKQHREIRKVYTRLEKARITLKEPLTKKIKLIDGEAKSIVARLDVISEPFKDAIDDRKIELAKIEAKRIADLTAEIENMKEFVGEAVNKSSIEIAEIIESVDLIEVDEHFAEFQSDARETLVYTTTKLAEMLSQAIQKELSDEETAEANKKATAAEEENKKLREQLAAMQNTNETEEVEVLDTNITKLKTLTISSKGHRVGETTSPELIPLLDFIDDWQSAWDIDKVAYAELSAGLKERGLI